MSLAGFITFTKSEATLFTYRKLPLINPGLIQLRKGFQMGLSTEGLTTGIKKVAKRAIALVEIDFHLLVF